MNPLNRFRLFVSDREFSMRPLTRISNIPADHEIAFRIAIGKQVKDVWTVSARQHDDRKQLLNPFLLGAEFFIVVIKGGRQVLSSPFFYLLSLPVATASLMIFAFFRHNPLVE